MANVINDPATHYDNVARAWQYVLGEDFHYGYFPTPDEPLETATENLTALMAEKAKLSPGMSVLDVGCGIGNPACLLAERYRCSVMGISTSGQCVKHAVARARDRACSDRASFAVADGMANGMPDNSFDRIWVMESSHLMPSKDKLLAECARVLRPGGRMVLCDIILRRDLPIAEVLKHARDFVCLRDAFGHAKMETLKTYGRLAGLAGLQIEESMDISEQTFQTFANWRRKLEENGDQVRSLIGDGGLEQLMTSCDILARFWKQPLLGYGLVVAVKGR